MNKKKSVSQEKSSQKGQRKSLKPKKEKKTKPVFDIKAHLEQRFKVDLSKPRVGREEALKYFAERKKLAMEKR